ncbi:phospholipase D-like domain-containing protein [Mycoplasma nasistruthionis]|uniref:Cardiolipin synthetase n=1 Tax=Mycoplasma nasistruthionis TaxID=353852 RepID=A0A5B7XVR7_9MOLU|nr:phospholipase D-like domain-containing protein [Mycoplasma nasistruthionis]QCZ36650.1 cardiolipin synthetase [Mycoplasma nasistruthionis]
MNSNRFNLKTIFLFIVQLLIFGSIIAGIAILILNVSDKYIYLFVFSFYLLNCVFVLLVYKQKRQHDSKFSWTYFILLLPFFGHILFFIYGRVFVNKNEIKISKDPKYNLTTYLSALNLDHKKLNQSPIKSLEKINDAIVLPASFKFFHEGYRFYDKLLKSLREAEKSIYIVTYIIKKSEISNEFYEILYQKAQQGVKIKWLVDDFGAMLSQKWKLRSLNKHPNIEISVIGKIYYPFINSASFTRNHQKFIIIDNNKVYSGGNNISDEYASLSKKYGHWIDLNYQITGPYINEYILHFIKFWKVITNKDIIIESSLYYEDSTQIKHNSQAYLITESPSFLYSDAEALWIKLFGSAKQSIKICTPYFAVTEAMKKQLIIALKSGVDVTIYFPGLPDKKTVHKIGLFQLRQYKKYGLKIKIYKHHFLHTKAGIIDNKIGWIGTSNMDSRSMYSQYETIDVITGKAISNLKKIFAHYDQQCDPVENIAQMDKDPNVIEKFVFDLTKPLI